MTLAGIQYARSGVDGGSEGEERAKSVGKIGIQIGDHCVYVWPDELHDYSVLCNSWMESEKNLKENLESAGL